jgi:hypothetical protein
MFGKLNKPSSVENKEKIQDTKINLHFFRHSIKGPTPENGEEPRTRLSAEGKSLAVQRAYKDVLHSQAVAFGSSRDRAQETAGFVMAGSSKKITGEETLEELKEKLNSELNVGSKIGVTEELNFTDDPSTPVGKFLGEAIARGEYLKAIVEDSDRIALETGDTSGATYSKKAAQMAQVLLKYVSIAPRWHKLVQEKSNQYQPTLERYMGTHQGMQESFLAKVIEKTKGLDERNAFLKAVGDQGFDFIEGFETDIITTGANGAVVKIKYNKNTEGNQFSFNQEVPLNVIQEILEEGK